MHVGTVSFDEFELKQWNHPDESLRKPHFWIAGLQEAARIADETCSGRWIAFWDSGNGKGRIWFESERDAEACKTAMEFDS